MKNLPQPIADYFAADSTKDADLVARCFAEKSVVVDEGHTYKGQASIKRWEEESSIKYQYTSTPIAFEMIGEKAIVTSRVVGNFKGSPLDLRYAFEMRGEKIAKLEVTL